VEFTWNINDRLLQSEVDSREVASVLSKDTEEATWFRYRGAINELTSKETTSRRREKKRMKISPGLSRVCPGRPGLGSGRANSQPVFCLDPARPQTWIGRVPGQPAEPGRVLKHWFGVR